MQYGKIHWNALRLISLRCVRFASWSYWRRKSSLTPRSGFLSVHAIWKNSFAFGFVIEWLWTKLLSVSSRLLT